MHPAATRTISYDPSKPAEECKKVILKQWAATISDFRERVRRTAADKRSADIRWGVLLWAPTLEEFLYFEEELLEPDPAAFKAEWVEGNHRGNATRNLYIYERASGAKRYSITLPEKGAKIQPYFDVPTVANGAHHFKISRVDTRPLIVQQQTTERWLLGQATLEEVREARRGAWAVWSAADAAYAAYAAADASTYSATAAAYAAAHAAADAAAYAADAADAAADAIRGTPEFAAARDAELMRFVGVIADALPRLPIDPTR